MSHPYKLEPWQQRLTDAELRLIRRFHHELNEEEKAQKFNLMQHVMDVEIRWGFFDRGVKSWLKRWTYRIFIHPWLRKQPNTLPE